LSSANAFKSTLLIPLNHVGGINASAGAVLTVLHPSVQLTRSPLNDGAEPGIANDGGIPVAIMIPITLSNRGIAIDAGIGILDIEDGKLRAVGASRAGDETLELAAPVAGPLAILEDGEVDVVGDVGDELLGVLLAEEEGEAALGLEAVGVGGEGADVVDGFGFGEGEACLVACTAGVL